MPKFLITIFILLLFLFTILSPKLLNLVQALGISPPLGDINRDGIINIQDFNFLVSSFSQNNCHDSSDLNGDCKIEINDVRELLQNYGQSVQDDYRQVVVVSDFTKYPQIQPLLQPLINIWREEGKRWTLIDVKDAKSYPGRDMAERLRNLLAAKYKQTPFRYLFLLDVRASKDDGINYYHNVPARIFYDTTYADPKKIWSDFYYIDLLGTFDVNKNGRAELSYNLSDYLAGDRKDWVAVGRIIFDEDLLLSQLQRYVEADISFRKSTTVVDSALMVKAWDFTRANSSNFWPLGNDLEESQTLDKAFSWNKIVKRTLWQPTKTDFFNALPNANLVYLYGHGNSQSQQINDNDYVTDIEMRNVANIHKNSVSFFGGCETGSVFDDSILSGCTDGTICFASRSIAQSLILNQNTTSKVGVAGVANSIMAASYPADYAGLLQAAFWYSSLAQVVSTRVGDAFSTPNTDDRTRLSLIYFGDPTLPFANHSWKETVSPNIQFSATNNRNFVVLDDESGVSKVEVSYDNEPFIRFPEISPNSPHTLNRYDKQGAVIKAYDRAGNVSTVERILN